MVFGIQKKFDDKFIIIITFCIFHCNEKNNLSFYIFNIYDNDIRLIIDQQRLNLLLDHTDANFT